MRKGNHAPEKTNHSKFIWGLLSGVFADTLLTEGLKQNGLALRKSDVAFLSAMVSRSDLSAVEKPMLTRHSRKRKNVCFRFFVVKEVDRMIILTCNSY